MKRVIDKNVKLDTEQDYTVRYRSVYLKVSFIGRHR